VSWLRANVMGPDQAVWELRITARDRYSDRCWGWGELLAEQVGPSDHAELPLQAACIATGALDPTPILLAGSHS
jgi:hypothetical protein